MIVYSNSGKMQPFSLIFVHHMIIIIIICIFWPLAGRTYQAKQHTFDYYKFVNWLSLPAVTEQLKHPFEVVFVNGNPQFTLLLVLVSTNAEKNRSLLS